MIWFILLFALFSPLLPICYVLINMDPFHLIAQVLIRRPLFKTTDTIICCILFKTFALALCSAFAYIVFKFMFITAYLLTLVLNHIRTYVRTLLTVNIQNSLLLRYHFTCLVFLQIVGQLVAELMLHLIVASQVLLTVFFWMSIHCTKLLPLFIIVGTITAFTGGVFLILTILGIAVNVRLHSDLLLAKKKAQFHGYNEKKLNYFFSLKWRSCRVLQISCGNNFSVTKNSVNIYLGVLNTNITNAVLLIIP